MNIYLLIFGPLAHKPSSLSPHLRRVFFPLEPVPHPGGLRGAGEFLELEQAHCHRLLGVRAMRAAVWVRARRERRGAARNPRQAVLDQHGRRLASSVNLTRRKHAAGAHLSVLVHRNSHSFRNLDRLPILINTLRARGRKLLALCFILAIRVDTCVVRVNLSKRKGTSYRAR